MRWWGCRIEGRRREYSFLTGRTTTPAPRGRLRNGTAFRNRAPVGEDLSITILEYSVIPEPSTLVLLLCGGVWLLISAWRRRRHNNPNLGTCR